MTCPFNSTSRPTPSKDSPSPKGNNSSTESTSYSFMHPTASDSRSPCPALNALANHGYISRTGDGITFMSLVNSLVHVYNLSYPLAFFLVIVGFLASAKCSFEPLSSSDINADDNSTATRYLLQIGRFFCQPLQIHWTLDLSSLSQRGRTKIAHDASLVHSSGLSSNAPNVELLSELLRFALIAHPSRSPYEAGLTLKDIAQFHALQEESLGHRLDAFHEQIALGECGLAWAIMRSHRDPMSGNDELEDEIPFSKLQEWFGEECLPRGWWDTNGTRPPKPIGLFEAMKRAKDVTKYMAGKN